jgi:hypothetical protein
MSLPAAGFRQQNPLADPLHGEKIRREHALLGSGYSSG